jgi:tyrosinase
MPINRRDVLSGIAATGLFAPALISRSWAQDALRVRPNIASLDFDDPILESYRAAVLDMMARGPDDPLSWYRQALIHRQACAHANYFFLPWHREYIRRFEAIIRTLSGNDQFVLPYWDWITDRQLPFAFWRTTHHPDNPLDPASLDFSAYEAADSMLADTMAITGRRRTIPPVALVGEDSLFTTAAIREQIELPAFSDFGSPSSSGFGDQTGASTFEDSYHGTVHVDIGGPMRRFYSPLDPIFWLHHANVDRLWTLWQAANPNSVIEPAWSQQPIPPGMFHDTDGMPAPGLTVADLVTTTALGYVYEPVPAQMTPLNPANIGQLHGPVRSTPVTGVAGERTLRVNTTSIFDGALPEAMVSDLFGRGQSRSPGRRIIASVEAQRAAEFADARLRVFLNCDYLSPSTPSNDPHFVTRLSLFSLGHSGEHAGHGGGGSARISFDLGPAIEAIQRTGEPTSPRLTVQIQALQLEGTAQSELSVGSLSGLEVAIEETDMLIVRR